MQHFFSGYSQTDIEVHSYINKLCATIQTSTDRALTVMARLNIILYSTKKLSGNTLPWLISAADLELSDKYVPACVEMRNLRLFPFYSPKLTTTDSLNPTRKLFSFRELLLNFHFVSYWIYDVSSCYTSAYFVLVLVKMYYCSFNY